MSATVPLGDFLALRRRSSADLRAWLQAQNPLLIERLTRESGIRGETIAHFLRIATADFMAEAGEEDWASLISALRDGDDPGAVCVARVMEFRLQLEHSGRRS